MTANGSSQIFMDLGIFAHNEEAGIAVALEDLARQDVFARRDVKLQVWILANGCSDQTVVRAQACLQTLPQACAAQIAVCDLAEGGKSRTGHHYIHALSRSQADILAFMDADIRLPQTDTLSRMLDELVSRPELEAYVSRPVKDVEHDEIPLGFVGRMIAAGGGGLTDFRTAICGQLFMLRADMARCMPLPIGLPVEDGFIRAMVVTDLLTGPEDLSRIDGHEEVYHVYESIRTLPELLRHQTRLVVGSAVNTVLFDKLRREASTRDEARAVLAVGAQDSTWLRQVLQAELPKAPYGYVHFSFLAHRLSGGKLRAALRRGPLALAITLTGFGLDVIVYLWASLRLMRGKAAGHW